MSFNDFLKSEKEKWEEHLRVNCSKRLFDIKDRTVKKYTSDDVIKLNNTLRSIHSLFKDLPNKRLNPYFESEKVFNGVNLIPWVVATDYFGDDTYKAMFAILTRLNDAYIMELRNRKFKITGNDYIVNGCIDRDISNANIADIPEILKIFKKIEDDLKAESLNHHWSMGREAVEQRLADEVLKSNVEVLKKFCKPNGTDFKVVEREGYTIIVLNGNELPKTRNRTEEFHNGYIEGFRRAIVMMQKIMGFEMYDKEKDKKKEKEIKEKQKATANQKSKKKNNYNKKGNKKNGKRS